MLYGDAYGDKPRYLGPIDQMTPSSTHSGANLASVTVTVPLSDSIDACTIASTLTATEPQLLTSSSSAKTLEIAITDQLRTPSWGSTPVARNPAWENRRP